MRAGRKAHRDHQRAADEGADIGDEGEQAGEDAEDHRHRHATDRQRGAGQHAFRDHAEQATGEQATQRLAHPFENRRELGAMIARHHPFQPALVGARVHRDEQADDDDHEHRRQRTEGGADPRGDPPDRRQRLFGDAADVGRAGHQPLRAQPARRAIRLRFQRRAQLPELVGDLHAGEVEGADQEGDRQQHDDQQPPAAPDRKHLAEQPHAAVEQRREHEAGEDDQQRLDQDHRQRDRAGKAQPDGRALQLAPDERIAQLIGAGLPRERRVRHRDDPCVSGSGRDGATGRPGPNAAIPTRSAG